MREKVGDIPLIVINSTELQQKILDCIASGEIDKYFNNTVFKDDLKCKQAMMYGMAIAGMMTSQCESYCATLDDETEEQNNEK